MQINDWLLRARDTNPGELPALPSASEGGSKVLLQEAAAAAAAQNAMPPAATKGPGKGPGKAAPPTAKRGKNAGELARHSPSMYTSTKAVVPQLYILQM